MAPLQLASFFLLFPATALGADTPDGVAGYHKVWEARIPVTGEAVASPALSWSGLHTYRVLVAGVLDLGQKYGRYDAEFRALWRGAFRHRHPHLRFEQGEWVKVYFHRPRHRYVYGLKPGASSRPVRVGVRYDGLPHRLRISPKQLRLIAQGKLVVSVWRKGPAPVKGRSGPWPVRLVVVGTALALLLGVFWVFRRRRKGTD
ncbi:MAG: hypothetical protein ABI333_17550 [bacterium]